MKSYDDLQRFKEKTQTNHIEFKDMSEQTKNSDSANWAIIKQLMNEGAGSALGNGQLTDIAAPQPIANDTFMAPHAQAPLSTQPHSLRPQISVQSHSVAAFVAKPATTQIGASLLESISASLKPAPAAEPVPAQAALAAAQPAQAVNPLAAAQPAQAVNSLAAAQPAQAVNPLAAAQPAQVVNPFAAAQATGPAPTSSLMAALPAATALARSAPVAAVQAVPAALTQPAPELPRFRQLFSSASEPSLAAISKDTLLQPLLERIASCR